MEKISKKDTKIICFKVFLLLNDKKAHKNILSHTMN